MVARALLQYRNTPLQGVNLSPAQILYGRVLKDHTPSLPELRQIRPEWKLQAQEREIALQKRNSKVVERYNRNSRTLPDLSVSDHVSVQNQKGTYPRRWDKTGKIVEKLANRQYNIRMDGSGRITLRNRKFIRKIAPVCSDPPLRFLTRANNGEVENDTNTTHHKNRVAPINENTVTTRGQWSPIREMEPIQYNNTVVSEPSSPPREEIDDGPQLRGYIQS